MDGWYLRRVRSSTEIQPSDDDEHYVWSFDQLQIDNPNPNAFTRLVYMERISRILDLVRRFVPPGGLVADLGCAQGNVAIALAEADYRVSAYDLNASFLSYARKKVDRGEVSWHVGNVFDEPQNETFDAVVLSEIVEHVAHPDQLLARALDVVHVGGVLVITTPNGRFVRDQLPSYQDIVTRGDLPADRTRAVRSRRRAPPVRVHA